MYVFNFARHNALNARIKENLGPINAATKENYSRYQARNRGLCLAFHMLGFQIHSSSSHVTMILSLILKEADQAIKPLSLRLFGRNCGPISN